MMKKNILGFFVKQIKKCGQWNKYKSPGRRNLSETTQNFI